MANLVTEQQMRVTNNVTPTLLCSLKPISYAVNAFHRGDQPHKPGYMSDRAEDTMGASAAWKTGRSPGSQLANENPCTARRNHLTVLSFHTMIQHSQEKSLDAPEPSQNFNA